MDLARTLLKRQPNQPIAVVKVAYSGTSINEWSPKGNCYQSLISETTLAIKKAKAQGITLHPRALVWVQGEGDANNNNVGSYNEKLGQMIKTLKKELRAPNLIALIGLNTRFGGGRNAFVPKIVEAQKSLAATSKYIEYVDSTGCDLANAAHFNSKGTLELGKRFGEKLIQTEKSIKRK